ncbi:MAG: transporter substrate-binding domain-containing protein [Coriobacteriia bacterium]|nr:transporter substrate-binding domain-containing protein [Coriobacteriia bacterium]
MKKKIFAVAAACLMLAFSAVMLAGCGSSSSSSKEKLVVGFDAAYPPYGYLVTDDGDGYQASDGNKYTGFDLDLASAVCEKNGWELEVSPIDWDSKDALLGSGDITCIWNGFTYEGREDNYAFSGLYMQNKQVVVVRADSDIKKLSDLKGKNVITQKDSAALDVLEGDQKSLADKFKKLETISDYNNAFMQLESGAVDAVACDLSIAAYQIAANPDKYAQLDESLSSEHYAVGFAKDNQEMADKVTDALKELDKEGKVKELCEKYADQGMDYANWCLEQD